MLNHKHSGQELLNYLKFNGPTLSSELVSRFGISRATLSRRVLELGDAVITIGKARATKIAARLEEFSSATPLYRILENGQAERIGQLTPIRDGEHTQWLLKAENAPEALLEGGFKDGLYPGWPWFLEDLRPAGFLGRSLAKHVAKLYQVDEDPEKWNDLELHQVLASHGYNLQGNLLLGEGRALDTFQEGRIKIAEGHYKDVSPEVYYDLAESALSEGEQYGSSAGGDQPKFTTLAYDSPEDSGRAVIVKFSPKLDTPSASRWADLLHAEHTANEVLREAGFDSARTRTFHFKERVFLESERFDRLGATGRRGLVSLRALDAAYLGQGSGSWAKAARKLLADKWITAADCERMIQLHCFGELIANTDMHWGNLSFFLPEKSPFPLAPVYDMLPMFFRPSSTGEIIEREFAPKLPKPEDQAAWLEMVPHALTYWQGITGHSEITPPFKKIAGQAIKALERIHKIASS
jgi:hypothetical protein